MRPSPLLIVVALVRYLREVAISNHEGSRPASGWRVSLLGHDADLRDAYHMFGSTALEVVQKDDEYFLRSSRFDSLTDAGEVLALVTSLLHVLNGIAKTRSRAFDGLSLRAHVERDNLDGTISHYGELGLPVRVVPEKEGVLADGTPMPANLKEDVSRLVAATDDKESISRALTIYGALGDDWRGLYMVLDVLEKDVDNLKAAGWASRNKIKLFKQTANNYGAVGLDARHGFVDPMRKNPMSIGEARRLLRTLLNKWLASKGH